MYWVPVGGSKAGGALTLIACSDLNCGYSSAGRMLDVVSSEYRLFWLAAESAPLRPNSVLPRIGVSSSGAFTLYRNRERLS